MEQNRIQMNLKMLYVGELSLITTESHLFKLFNSVSQVAGVFLPRDRSNFSRGFAFIRFWRTQDAARAKKMLNNIPLNGKPIRVKYAIQDPGIPTFGVGKLFIKNLDKAVDAKALNDGFSKFGKILSCKIVTDSSGQSKGYGSVRYNNMEAAQIAIEKMNGKLLNEKKIYVEPFLCKGDREMVEGERVKPRFVVNEAVEKSEGLYLYIDNVDESIGDDKFIRLFSQFGKITSWEVSAYSGRFGTRSRLVAFSTPKEASRARLAMNGKMVGNKLLYIRCTRKTQPQPQPPIVTPFVLGGPEQAPHAYGPRQVLRDLWSFISFVLSQRFSIPYY